MVRFFGVLSSLMVCLPLSMALGFSLLEQGRRCEVTDECVSGFDGWDALGVMTGWRVIGILSGRVFFLNAKGFH
jgi:hypothetical protein